MTSDQARWTDASAESRGPRGAYFYFDVIRFLAAFAVLIGHVRNLYWRDAPQAHPGFAYQFLYLVTGFGHEAVMIFFVLSGFWISRSIDRGHTAPGFSQNYAIARLSRILIVFVPALIVGGAIDAIGCQIVGGPYYSGHSGSNTVMLPVHDQLNAMTLLGNLAFTQGQLVRPFGSNGPLWSLTNEFWYYWWFPALFLLIKRRRPNWMMLALPMVAIMPGLLGGFAVWLFGSALYFAHDRWLAARATARHPGRLILALSLVLMGAALGLSRIHLFTQMPTDIAVGLSFTAVAASLLALNPEPLPWLAPLARYGAGASYSLYAAHFPMVLLVVAIVSGGARVGPSLGSLAIGTMVVAAAVAWGRLFAALTEAHTYGVRRKLTAGLPPRRAWAA